MIFVFRFHIPPTYVPSPPTRMNQPLIGWRYNVIYTDPHRERWRESWMLLVIAWFMLGTRGTVGPLVGPLGC